MDVDVLRQVLESRSQAFSSQRDVGRRQVQIHDEKLGEDEQEKMREGDHCRILQKKAIRYRV